jgi:hypothetical protein
VPAYAAGFAAFHPPGLEGAARTAWAGEEAGHRVLGAVNYRAPREGLNIPALPSLWAARALLDVARPGIRPLQTLVTFDEAATSLRAHGFDAFVE